MHINRRREGWERDGETTKIHYHVLENVNELISLFSIGNTPTQERSKYTSGFFLYRDHFQR